MVQNVIIDVVYSIPYIIYKSKQKYSQEWDKDRGEEEEDYWGTKAQLLC
jgi:hypothetical protein